MKSGRSLVHVCKYCWNYRPLLVVKTRVSLIFRNLPYIHWLYHCHEQSTQRNLVLVVTLSLGLVNGRRFGLGKIWDTMQGEVTPDQVDTNKRTRCIQPVLCTGMSLLIIPPGYSSNPPLSFCATQNNYKFPFSRNDQCLRHTSLLQCHCWNCISLLLWWHSVLVLHAGPCFDDVCSLSLSWEIVN